MTRQDTLNLIKSTVAHSNVIYYGCVPLNWKSCGLTCNCGLEWCGEVSDPLITFSLFHLKPFDHEIRLKNVLQIPFIPSAQFISFSRYWDKRIPVSLIKKLKNTANICVHAINISHYSIWMQSGISLDTAWQDFSQTLRTNNLWHMHKFQCWNFCDTSLKVKQSRYRTGLVQRVLGS